MPGKRCKLGRPGPPRRPAGRAPLWRAGLILPRGKLSKRHSLSESPVRFRLPHVQGCGQECRAQRSPLRQGTGLLGAAAMGPGQEPEGLLEFLMSLAQTLCWPLASLIHSFIHSTSMY